MKKPGIAPGFFVASIFDQDDQSPSGQSLTGTV